jgi:hypothetical protein
VSCSGCRASVPEPRRIENREPCPTCGSIARTFVGTLTDRAEAHDSLAGPSNPGPGDGGRCPLIPTGPTSRTASRGSTPVVYLDVPGTWLTAPLGYESLERRSGVSVWLRTGLSTLGLRLSPTGGCPVLFLPVSDGLVSKP